MRELARLTAELEIERLEERSQAAPQEAQEVQEAVQTVLVGQGNATPRRHVRREAQLCESPQVPVPDPQPRSSPGGFSSASSVGDDILRSLDRERLCKDVLLLMTCEELKVGLRAEGLTLSV